MNRRYVDGYFDPTSSQDLDVSESEAYFSTLDFYQIRDYDQVEAQAELTRAFQSAWTLALSATSASMLLTMLI